MVMTSFTFVVARGISDRIFSIDRILEIAGNSLTEYYTSNLIAQDVVKEHGDDVQEVHVRIVSQIGRRIDDPHVASLQVIYADNVDPSKLKNNIRNLADDRLAKISELTKMFTEGKVAVF